jgi:uncharacterized alpha-E superfamily protein
MTARILDVRYHLLLPDVSLVGSPLDYYQWGALLKSLSGFTAYRRNYQAGIRPIDVVEFVVLNPDFPRSLAYCLNGMERAIARIGPVTQGAVPEALRTLREHLAVAKPKDILDQGLHEFLDDFLALLAGLALALQTDYFDAYLGDEGEQP